MVRKLVACVLVTAGLLLAAAVPVGAQAVCAGTGTPMGTVGPVCVPIP